MANQAALNRAFADYARTIARRYDIGDVLYRLTDQMLEVLDVDGAGVSIAERGGRLSFVTATDDRVARVEAAQIESGEGACYDAFVTGEPTTSADLTAEGRWPGYVEVAAEHGLRGVAGIPMGTGEDRIGALNLYTAQPRTWRAEDLEVGQLLADMATGYVMNARTLTESQLLANQLQHALDSRIVIEQAKGIIAERQGLDTADAFQLIRKHARSHNARLHDIAAAIVDGSLKL